MKCPIHEANMVMSIGDKKDTFQDITFSCPGPDRHEFVARIRLTDLVPGTRLMPSDEFEGKAAAKLVASEDGFYERWFG